MGWVPMAIHKFMNLNLTSILNFAGLVAFRLKGDNALTERLLKGLNARGRMHSVPACFKGIYVIRYVVTSQRTMEQDILGKFIKPM